jgi:PAS domain S-box-containing protein
MIGLSPAPRATADGLMSRDGSARSARESRDPAPFAYVSTWAACLIVCIAYSLAGAAGVLFLQRILTPDLAGVAVSVGVPWLPVGLGVSGLLLFGRRAWPGVFAGSCVTWGVIQGDGWLIVLLGAASEAVSIVLIAWLLEVWRYRRSLERYQDALILIAAAALGRIVTSGADVIGLVAEVWAHLGPKSPLILDEAGVHRSGDVIFVTPALLMYGLRWWANTMAGVVLVVPLLAFFERGADRPRSPPLGEAALWASASAVWLGLALSLSGSSARLSLLAGALVLVVWAALRLGVAVASVGTLAFSIVTTAGFGLQLGVFAGTAGRESIEIQWGFIALLSGVGLFLTALLSGGQRAQRELAAATDRYRRLFYANSNPMWAEDVASGAILVANDAALNVYGYTKDAFLRLHGRDVSVRSWPLAIMTATERPDDERPYAAVHRAASGKTFEVEVSPVHVELNGATVRVCFIDPVDERNDLRVAVLSAAELERQRLGAEIRERLATLLAELGAGADRILRTAGGNPSAELDRLEVLEEGASTAIAICRQLTRGASPIQFASGDLIEALRGLPALLEVEGGPRLELSVRSFAPVTLSLERCEHAYRIAQDAVRLALLRPGARHVHVAIAVTADSVEITVEDDGEWPETGRPEGEWQVSPMALRAAATRASLSIEPRRAGGTRVRFECDQRTDVAQPAAAQPTGDRAAGDRTDGEGSAAAAAVGTGEPVTARSTAFRASLEGVLLFLACVATGAAGLLVLQHIDAQRVAFVPGLAFPWLANGVAVVGLFLGGVRLAPAIFFSSIAVWRGLVHDPWITVVADAFGETLCAILVVQLLHRWGFRRSFDRARDLGLLVVAAAVGRTIPLVFDLVGLQLAVALAPESLPPEMRAAIAGAGEGFLGVTWLEVAVGLRWWINGVAGITLLVPAVVSMSADLRRVLLVRWRETVAYALALGLTAATVAGGPGANWRLPLLALGVVLVSWAAVRFSVAFASVATLVLALGATVGYGLGLGPFAPTTAAEGSEVLWQFISLLAATGLFLTTVIANQDKAVRELRELKARYETLFEAIPRAVIACSEETGRITTVNAEAVRKYGYTRGELLAMRPDDLVADAAASEAQADATGSIARAVHSTVHRTRSGAIFEAEVSSTRVALSGVAEQLLFIIDVTERNDLRRRVLEASDLERRRLAHELHDGLGQTLTGLAMGVASLRRTIERSGVASQADLQFVSNVIGTARGDCDRIINGLSPLEATAGDLLLALRNLPAQLPPQSRQQLSVEIRADAELRLPLAMREHLYHIAREAVNNALKHARASHIAVEVSVAPDRITLVVADDGVGFDPALQTVTGLGLKSLALRSAVLRAQLSVERRHEGGIAVTCRCPHVGAAAALSA